jgi:tryptophanyl-tRNA synthetase
MLTGIQPTGQLMIGNYLGAIRNWVELQATHEAFLFLADLHAITVSQEPVELRLRSLEYAALFEACGVDTERSTIFLQSHVPAHAQLLWVLNCIAPMGDLQRMTQFKEKAGRRAGDIHVGLFDYPVLMAADILLYGADLVPVGEDQKQHMEFTRRLARKFNAAFGEVFRIPEVITPRTGARLMGLQTPTAKMSKSDRNADNYVALLDPPETVQRKIGGAVTDSGSEVSRDAGKPGITNLIALYSAVTGESAGSIENRYAGKGYAEFKRELAERVVDFLRPIQMRYRSIAADQARLAEVLRRGARAARERSEKTLARVHRAVGLIPGEGDHRRRTDMRPFSQRRPPDIPMPASPRALAERRIAMETKESKDANAAAAAEADADTECPTDCCVCCCCDTEAECSVEE